MRLNKKSLLLATGLMFANHIYAATALNEGGYFIFDKNTTEADMAVRAYSWYNLSMGYEGWTHHSNWGFVKLKKGKPVTIKLTTEVDGLHPAISTWYRAKAAKKVSRILNMNSHKYKQFGDVFEPDTEVTDSEGNPKKIGNLIMKFVTNGFDRDGMPDSLPMEYDQSQIYRVMDGEPGQLTITFTPEAGGWYQFAVGALNPDEGSTAYGTGPGGSGAGPADTHTVHVAIDMP